jgi:hypothetical protein
VVLEGDTECWTLEGDPHWFEHRPEPNRRVRIQVVAQPPESPLGVPLSGGVWVNRARGWLHPRVELLGEAPGELAFATFPDVETAFRLQGSEAVEEVDRHTVRVRDHEPELTRYLVVGREALLEAPPPEDLFADPPFALDGRLVERVDGHVRIVFPAPRAARVRLIEPPLDLRSSRDGRYWWAEVPAAAMEGQTVLRLQVDDAEVETAI